MSKKPNLKDLPEDERKEIIKQQVARGIMNAQKKMIPQKPNKIIGFIAKTFNSVVSAWGEFLCSIGVHEWKICSGRKGDPKYTCIRCWERSSQKWGKGGSSKHYAQKKKNKPK